MFLSEITSRVRSYGRTVVGRWRSAASAPPIDLVQLGPLTLYWFCKDYYYKTMPDDAKKASLKAHFQRVKQDGFCYLPHPGTETTRGDAYRGSPLLHALCELATFLSENGRKTTYFDLGCFYGFTCLYMADFFRRRESSTKCYCFEPGRAGDLVPANISLNGLEDYVVFEPLAITEHGFPVVFQADPEHLDSASIAYAARSGSEFRFVKSVTLPTYLDRRQIDTDLVLKIDIEGLDFLVLDSIQEARPETVMLGAIELNNCSLRNMGFDPATCVERLLKGNHVVVLPPSKRHGPMQWVGRPGGVTVLEVIEMIDRQCGYVDLLFAPKSLVNVDSVMNGWVCNRYCWAHE